MRKPLGSNVSGSSSLLALTETSSLTANNCTSNTCHHYATILFSCPALQIICACFSCCKQDCGIHLLLTITAAAMLPTCLSLPFKAMIIFSYLNVASLLNKFLKFESSSCHSLHTDCCLSNKFIYLYLAVASLVSLLMPSLHCSGQQLQCHHCCHPPPLPSIDVHIAA